MYERPLNSSRSVDTFTSDREDDERRCFWKPLFGEEDMYEGPLNSSRSVDTST